MPATYSYPGVYVEEDASLSLAVTSGATAVPVIAYDGSTGGDNQGLTPYVGVTVATRIDSWLDFTKPILAMNNPSLLLSAARYPLYRALKTYFDNGGGYCYVCPVDQLVAQVPGYDDVTLLVQAGTNLTTFTPALSTLLGDGKSRFAIFDGPATLTNNDAVDMANYGSSAYAAAYYPALQADWASDGNKPPSYYDIPVSAAVAGVYCATDQSRGVWKAPANVQLQGGVWPKVKVSDVQQSYYTVGASCPKPLNMIRCFQTGIALVWGARTLASDQNKDRWQYVPVRRLFNAAEKDIKRAMAFAVFEPNNQPTWEKVRAAIDAYLHGIWRAGGLMGAKPEEAYFVQVGLGVTMTQDDINKGQMMVKVGMAPVFPAEFIILQFTQDVMTA